MSDRVADLRGLASRIREHDVVTDAFLAKSFTDRLLIVDVRQGESVPEDIRDTLARHGLSGTNEVYGSDDEAGTDGETRSFAGDVGDSTRHHFVDVETSGEHRSYVVE